LPSNRDEAHERVDQQPIHDVAGEGAGGGLLGWRTPQRMQLSTQDLGQVERFVGAIGFEKPEVVTHRLALMQRLAHVGLDGFARGGNRDIDFARGLSGNWRDDAIRLARNRRQPVFHCPAFASGDNTRQGDK
jgi:hypothetical protein